MTGGQLLIRSILYYWRTNLAVLLGVIAGTAVIGGALIVGDSVRGSLGKMTRDRLGDIDHVLHSGRFFREKLADEIAADDEFGKRFDRIAPALMLQGSVVFSNDSSTARANQVNVYGLDERLWNLTGHHSLPPPVEQEIILSRRLADQLRVQAGDDVSLWVEIPTSIPRDSLLGNRDETSREISLTVKLVLDELSHVGRLALNPNQQLPLNAFVSLKQLQRSLDLDEHRDRQTRAVTPARVNALFVRAIADEDGSGKAAEVASSSLTSVLARTMTLEDVSLRVKPNTRHGYLSLESEQQILADVFADAGSEAAKQLQLQQSAVLVYLANRIENATDPNAISKYSVIAGLDFSTEPPFGPFGFLSNPPKLPLKDNEIVLNDWLANDLHLKASPGDELIVKYHQVGSHGELPELEEKFVVRGVVKLDGTLAADRGLTPEVKGITDAKSLADWEQPFPMDLPVTERDDEYWGQYGPTPKAFVSLSKAQSLWKSRYGKLTSLRVSKKPETTLDQTRKEFAAAVLTALDPRDVGLVFQPTKFDGLKAAGGTTPFSGLFIGFSFFLILSATILIGLLFRLGIERRGTNIGLLSAVGFSPTQVRKQFLSEGLIVVCTGGVLGVVAAVGYAKVMVYGLKTWWIGAIGTKFLYVFVTPLSLIGGFAISVAVASLVIWWALRQMRTISTRDLLAGQTEQALTAKEQQQRGKRASQIAIVSSAIAAVLLGGALTGLIPANEAFSGFSWLVVAFFIVGVCLLTASLAFLSAWLDSDRSAAVRGAGMTAMARLGMRNAARHRQRSVMSVGLIASATFVIVAVAAGRRNPAVETPVKESGNGGFSLVAESSTPILYDLETRAGREKLNFQFNDTTTNSDKNLIEQMQVISFRRKPGEEASCLNIYQTRLPTILGVSQAMIDRGGFKFIGAKQENPWTSLNDKLDNVDHKINETGNTKSVPVYPVLGDMNSLMYSLHKAPGDTIAVPNDENPDYLLQVVGMLDGSVFQGVLLIAEPNFLELYPDRKGYEYFLIETPLETSRTLAERLETRLTEYGFDAEPVGDRLKNFLAVQNTYLSTFQTLGGLGLLLGTLGLSTVMLRNVLERRGELALLRAVGFRKGSLSLLVLWENAFLLLWGLVAGAGSALLAMLPHLTSIGADVPWTSGGLILGGVFVVGMLAAFFAVTEAVRTPILSTLRSE